MTFGYFSHSIVFYFDLTTLLFEMHFLKMRYTLLSWATLLVVVAFFAAFGQATPLKSKHDPEKALVHSRSINLKVTKQAYLSKLIDSAQAELDLLFPQGLVNRNAASGGSMD